MASWPLDERTILQQNRGEWHSHILLIESGLCFPTDQVQNRICFKDTEKGKVSNISSWLILEAGE